MKLILWKEWRELRLMPLNALAINIALLFVVALIDYLSHQAFTYDVDFPILMVLWVIFSIAAGAGTFAPEVGSGTLQFISVLPISRSRYWGVKVATAALAAIASVIVTGIFWIGFMNLKFPSEFASNLHQLLASNSPGNPHTNLEISLSILTAVTCCFAAGICASPLFDRALSAGSAGLVGGIFYAVFVVHGSHRFEHLLTHRHTLDYSTPAQAALFLLGISPLIATSYWTFVHGESLKSRKKYVLGTTSFLASVAFCLVLFVIGTLVKLF